MYYGDVHVEFFVEIFYTSKYVFVRGSICTREPNSPFYDIFPSSHEYYDAATVSR
jgi:hypothetical protein